MKLIKNGRYLPGLALLSLSILTVLITACSSGGQLSFNGAAPSATVPTISLQINLTHSPVGTATLMWKKGQQTLQVNVTASGLAPNSVHPLHIHAGTCADSQAGTMVFNLTPLKADAHGVGTSTTSIAGVAQGIPAKGWFLNLHNGPSLADELQARSIACGDIVNKTPSAQANQQVQLALTGTTAPDESVQGTALLQLGAGGLVVTLTVKGLAPKTMHMAHVHSGTCQAQGDVVYPLQPVVADAQGNGSSTTLINSVKTIPITPMYINIHEAGSMAGMSTPQGFNPIACGNIVLP